MKRLAMILAIAGSLHGATYFVTVAGLGGTPDYESVFEKWAGDLQKELEKNGATGDQNVLLRGNGATRSALEQTLTRLAAQIKPEDEFALFLIGHGTFDGTDYKFNLPGPDISAAELVRSLDRINAKRQLVVNMTSASGASVPVLARKGRIVIAATKSGTERNATVFPRYWIDGMRDPAADLDKNGVVSTLELYRYATQKTAAYFEQEKLLATEHAIFIDSGTTPVRDPRPENGQGLLAARFAILEPPGESVRNVSPEKQRLVARKEDLEAQIDKLKYAKAAMAPEEYKQQLTTLLLELARTQAEIDK
ncbi:MAG TPA: hypothetical protein VKX25_05260 [Bryobacteraceae bacterium]|jgi:lysophospholipase L1-like esterase|nr:hypothetical protein [Bryobacteraceae bacterium]